MSKTARGHENAAPFQAIVPGSAWAMNFTNAPAQSPKFDGVIGSEYSGTTILRLLASQDCHVAVGANPTAVQPPTNGTKVPAQVMVKQNSLAYIGVEPGQKLSVVRDATSATDGVLYVSEGA